MTNMDWMVDFETLGLNTASDIIVNCASLRFDWDRIKSDNPYSFRELVQNTKLYKLDIAEQKNIGWTTDVNCINEFWMKQPPSIRNQLKPSNEDIKLEKFANHIIEDTRGIDRWWARRFHMEVGVIHRIMRHVGKLEAFEYNAKYYKATDTPTHINAKFDNTVRDDFCPVTDVEFWDKVFQKHNSVHDVAADVMRLQTIYRAENELEQTKR